jgi:hypothetical protein
MQAMPKPSAAPSGQALANADDEVSRGEAEVIAFDDVAWRRERLLAYAAQTRTVVIYRFVMPAGAQVQGLGPAGDPRDARDQLHLIVGLTGGGVTRSHGGLAARIPKVLTEKFEAMAGPLIAAYLVSLDLGDADAASL